MNAVEFTPHGPFELSYERSTKRVIFDRDLLWDGPDAGLLAESRGCYVLAVKRGKTTLPFYVGLTRASFRREIFNPSNLRKYHAALKGGKKYQVVLFLIEHPKSKKSTETKFIGELEDFFIGTGFARNPGLGNSKGRPRPKWKVPHVTAPAKGKPTKAARALREVMGLEDSSHHRFAGRAFRTKRQGMH